jgi:ribosomal protein S18 acetylase RimI-like enzyme
MSIPLVFRETQPSDIESLFSIRARTRENALSQGQLALLGITPESAAAGISSGRVKGWVCADAANLVGFCSVDSQTGEVLVLAVLPEYEGRGIGKRLLSYAVEFLRLLGFGEAWLAATSNATIRAHGFYRALGWRPTGAKHESGDEILRLTL